MADMEIVRQFNSELSTIYETKPPISKAKVTQITRLAIKAIKYYKHVVQSIEKFVQKCRQEYKVPALYVMDSLIRGSRHQFGADKDVFGPRFVKNINQTFQLLFKCPPEDQGRIIKVLNLWQKNGIYGPEIIQPLLNMASQNNSQDEAMPVQPINNKEPLAVSEPIVSMPPESGSDYVAMLQQQQQQHLQKIQQLQQQLQEQQKLNQIQSQQPQVAAPLTQPQEQLIPPPSSGVQLPQPLQQLIQGHAGQPQPSTQTAPPHQAPVGIEASQVPQFQLQPHIFAQIQALTGMNIRPTQQLPNQKVAQDQLQVPGPFEQQGFMGNIPEATLHAAAQVVENTVQNQQGVPLFPGGPVQGPPNTAQNQQGTPLFPGGPSQGPPNTAQNQQGTPLFPGGPAQGPPNTAQNQQGTPLFPGGPAQGPPNTAQNQQGTPLFPGGPAQGPPNTAQNQQGTPLFPGGPSQGPPNTAQNQQGTPLFPGGPAQGPPNTAQNQQGAPLFPGGPAQGPPNTAQNQQGAPLFPGGPVQGPPNTAQNQQGAPLFPGGPAQGPPNVVSPWTAVTGMPVVQQHEQQNAPQSDDDKKHTSLLDDFDYGDEQDDETRLEEQRRHLLEEERRLKQEGNFDRNAELEVNNKQDSESFASKFRPIGEQNRFEDTYEQSSNKFYKDTEQRLDREKSPVHRHRSRSPRNKSPRRRSRSPRWRSRSPSGTERGRDRERQRDRDRERDRERDRDREREREKDRERERDRGRERERDRERSDRDKQHEKIRRGIPPVVENMLSVCSTTIWAGHLPKLAQQNAVSEIFEDYGTVKSVDMVPPRGCAYVVMVNREDASKAIEKKVSVRLYGNALKIAWAPGKGVKGREYKEFFDVNLGVTYIPWDKLVGQHVDLEELADGGWIDPETMPPGYQATTAGSKETAENSKDLGNMSQNDLMQLAVAQAPAEPTPNSTQPNAPTQISTSVPPPTQQMYPGPPHQMLAPPVHMMRPPFQGAPHMPPGMVPPAGLPPGAPPVNMQGPPPSHFVPQGDPADSAQARGHFVPQQEHRQGMPGGHGPGGHPSFPQHLPFGIRPPSEGQGPPFHGRGPRFMPNLPPHSLAGGPARPLDFRGPPPRENVPHLMPNSGQAMEQEIQQENQNGPDQDDSQLLTDKSNNAPDQSSMSKIMSVAELQERNFQEGPGNTVGPSHKGVPEEGNERIEGSREQQGVEGMPHEGSSFRRPPHSHAVGILHQEGPLPGGPNPEMLRHEDPPHDRGGFEGPPPDRWPVPGGPQHEWRPRMGPPDGHPFHRGPRFFGPPNRGPALGENMGPQHQGPEGPFIEGPLHDGPQHRPPFERPPHGFPIEGPSHRGLLQGPPDGPPQGGPPFERPFFGRPPFGGPFHRFRGPPQELHRGPPPGPWGPRGPPHHVRGPRFPQDRMLAPPDWQEGRPQDEERIEENTDEKQKWPPIEPDMKGDHPTVQPVDERLNNQPMESQEEGPERREGVPRVGSGQVEGRWRDRNDERQLRDREERNSARWRPSRDSFENDREKDRDQSSQRDRDRDRDRQQDRDRDRYRDRERDRNRDRIRDRERRRERDRERDQEHGRSRDKDRERERDRDERPRQERNDRIDGKKLDESRERRSRSRSKSEDRGSQSAVSKTSIVDKLPAQGEPGSSAIPDPTPELPVTNVNTDLQKNIDFAEPEEGEIRDDNECEVVKDSKSGDVLPSSNTENELKSQINDKQLDLKQQNQPSEMEALSS